MWFAPHVLEFTLQLPVSAFVTRGNVRLFVNSVVLQCDAWIHDLLYFL